MAKFILAAVEHASDSEALLSDECAKEFKKRITPLLTQRSCVLGEGHFEGHLVGPHDPDYWWHYREFVGALTPVRPALGFFDPRQEGDENKKAYISREIHGWFDRCNELLESYDVPETKDELNDLLRSQKFLGSMKAALTSSDRERGRLMQKLNRKFDRNYTDAMKRYSASHDVCVLVAGYAHCANIAVYTSWSLEFLVRKDWGELLISYFIAYTLPQLVSRGL